MMLDTNIVSALLRAPSGAVARRIGEMATAVSVSVVVAAELRYGAARKGSARLTTAVEAILGAMDIAPFASPADLVYAHLRYRMEREGRPLGGNDLLIAAHALTLDRGLATDDRAFERVPGLHVENWLT
jgi:tRNA(fMet)-specific endonuclease VapC